MRRTYRQKPLILVEYAHISMRLHADKVLFDDAALVVHDIISIAGYTQACVVAHSFGAFVASRLCKLHPEVSRTVQPSLCNPPSVPSVPSWTCMLAYIHIEPMF